MVRLPQRKDESFPFKWGNEVQSWVLFLKLSTSVFVEAGSVRLWVSAGATGQPRWGSVWQRGSLYSTSDARTGTLSRFDPRVSWITHRSFHSCDYKAQRYTLDNVSVLSSKAFTATENCFWRFLRQFDILNNKIRMSILFKSGHFSVWFVFQWLVLAYISFCHLLIEISFKELLFTFTF